MQVANIYPIANQEMYAKEKCVMLLAHLFDKYDPKFFNDKQWIIMDNGAFENSKVSNDLERLVGMAENSPIPIKEIVIPDVMGNEKATLELLMNNFNTIAKWQHKYKFMFVAHSNTEEELDKLVTMFNKSFAKYNLSIGIPKRVPYPRDGLKAANVYSKSLFPIHLLGLKRSFDELLPVKNVVRSCDSSQIAFMAKNKLCQGDIDYLIRYRRQGTPIDLEHDVLDKDKLNTLYKKEQEDFKEYGLL